MAASAPPTPSEALALVSDPTSSLCGNFVRTLLRLPVLFYNTISWLLDESGVGVRTLRAGDKIESFTPLTEDDHRKLCNGQALDREQYAELYAAIGNTYDTMDGQSAPGSLLFRVPKCGARFACAVGSLPSGAAVALATVDGEEEHTLTIPEMPEHHHAGMPGTENDSTTGGDEHAAYTGTTLLNTDDTGGDQPHNNMPPYYGIFVYICTGK